MQLIKTMINHVFIPILTLLFLCSGLLAAVTSATIEYSVFISLFTSVQQTFISPSLLALLFVIPLEYTKIFSHYLNGKLHEASPSFSKHFTRKVGVLVLIPSIQQRKSFCKTGYCKNSNQYLKHFFIPFFRASFFSDEVSNTKIRYSYT